MIGAVERHATLLALVGVVNVAIAAYAWRRRDQPGARQFAGLTLSFAAYALTHLAGVLTHQYGPRMVWEGLQWASTLSIPSLWLVFALTYTGHDQLVSRRLLALLTGVPAALSLTVWTNGWHGLFWTSNELQVVDGLALLDQSFGPAFWVAVAFIYATWLVGSLLVVRLAVASEYLYVDQSALMLVGITAPIVASVATVTASTPSDPQIDLTPYAFCLTGLVFGYALFRRRLLDLVPATRQVGRRQAIANLDDGIVILDDDRRIVYLNRAAAEAFQLERSAAVGAPVERAIDPDDIDLDSPDSLAEVTVGDRTFEVRSSPIEDRSGRQIGDTLVVGDVTERVRRERELRRQRDALRAVERINSVVRGINGALVSADSREQIERAVCDRLAGSPLYDSAWVADRTDDWTGRRALPDGGTTAAESPPPVDLPDVSAFDPAGSSGPRAPVGGAGDGLPESPAAESRAGAVSSSPSSPAPTPDSDDPPTRTDGGWTVVPLSYGRTVYGALVLYTDREEALADRERAVLDELGATIGHAMNAVESRRLLGADAVVELEYRCTDPDAALVAATRPSDSTEARSESDSGSEPEPETAGATLELAGLVPADEGTLAYLQVDEGDPAAVADRLDDVDGVGSARHVEGSPPTVEATLDGGSPAETLLESATSVRAGRAEDGAVTLVAEAAPDADVGAITDRVTDRFPDTELVAKRKRDHPVGEGDLADRLEEESMTDRQREVLEAAYRAGYFDWPRESTAEEVADSLGIAGSTLHSHLRKAERELVGAFFEEESFDRRIHGDSDESGDETDGTGADDADS